MRTTAADLFRGLRVMTIALLPLYGCVSPERQEGMVDKLEPQAIEAAIDRARTDLNCGAVKPTVLSREHGDLSNQYNLHRVLYRIEVTGCKLSTIYSVACVPNAVCSAISESGTVQRTQ
jgi:hypothetical protein